jgi:hypothetical protein
MKKFFSFLLHFQERFRSFLPLSSRGIPLTQNKTKQNNEDKILPLFPNSQLFLSLLSFAHLRGKENGFKKRETRREHAPPLNNISAPVVHHE